MVKKDILNSICSSEVRKNILLLLNDGPADREAIRNNLDVTIQTLVPHMNTLEDNYLVIKTEDIYTLTSMGRAIVNEVIPLLDMIDFFEKDIEYWGTHDLDFIPPHLVKRINEFGSCARIEVPLSKVYEAEDIFIEQAKDTKLYSFITSFVFPNFKEILIDLAANDTDILIIISNELYQKILSDFKEDLEYILQLPKLKIYVYNQNFKIMSFTLTDHNFLLRLLTLEGDYDHKRVICASDQALKWGNDLFEYYLNNSIEITQA
ncbi:helix-turn-helix transcriptional regulator [Methanolobus halotolerans]|uniref:Transcriptional regulator n=1 Tax=Methanolobus halotolerans TaxID=2052935 RepID=A0A4E0PXF8_9EURY|nr:winged helix-turn-helix domain-containing protein [Methanolobus halotolerans]TGC09432.1 transcriptional regulator [Methanolobus halotolerans]